MNCLKVLAADMLSGNPINKNNVTCWQAKSIESCNLLVILCPYSTWCCVQGVLLPMPLTISFRIWQHTLHLWEFKLSMCILSPHRHHEQPHWGSKCIMSDQERQFCLTLHVKSAFNPLLDTGRSQLLSKFHRWHQSIIYSYANLHTCTSLKLRTFHLL